MKNKLLKGFNEEQIAKAKECKSEEELLELDRKEGVKLTDEQLASISGGCNGPEEATKCPNCGSKNISEEHGFGRENFTRFECQDCGADWYIK